MRNVMKRCKKLKENVIKRFEKVNFHDIALTTIKDKLLCC